MKLENCVNERCPFSGKPVAEDSLCEFEGRIFGFCNPGCRDKFAASPESYPDAVEKFRAAASAPEQEKGTF